MATYKEAVSAGQHLRVKQQPLGDTSNANNRNKVRFAVVDITFSNSYPTGGETITASDLRFGNIEGALIGANGGYMFSLDLTSKTAPKVLAWRSAAGAGAHAQAPNTTDLSGITARALVWGTP